MFKKKLLIDAAVFVIIVFGLLWVIPIISRIMRELIVLEVVIILAAAIGLRLLLNKIRKRYAEPGAGSHRDGRKRGGASQKGGKGAD